MIIYFKFMSINMIAMVISIESALICWSVIRKLCPCLPSPWYVGPFLQLKKFEIRVAKLENFKRLHVKLLDLKLHFYVLLKRINQTVRKCKLNAIFYNLVNKKNATTAFEWMTRINQQSLKASPLTMSIPKAS